LTPRRTNTGYYFPSLPLVRPHANPLGADSGSARVRLNHPFVLKTFRPSSLTMPAMPWCDGLAVSTETQLRKRTLPPPRQRYPLIPFTTPPSRCISPTVIPALPLLTLPAKVLDFPVSDLRSATPSSVCHPIRFLGPAPPSPIKSSPLPNAPPGFLPGRTGLSHSSGLSFPPPSISAI